VEFIVARRQHQVGLLVTHAQEGRYGCCCGVLSLVCVSGEILERQLLDNIAAPYGNCPLGYSDLVNLRDELTLAYVDRGYVTSEAVIESQSINDGVLRNEGRVGALCGKRAFSNQSLSELTSRRKRVARTR
jgi:hemolysin activation/secretion protein